MKIRMLASNCECWKKNDVFEVKTGEENHLYIECHDTVNGGEHYLLDDDYEEITDITKLADIHEIIKS